MEFGFRYLLVHVDGSHADPAAFVTTVLRWRAGDEFVGGDGMQRYRILDIVFRDPPHSYNGVFLVEPVAV
jgi:hypothetical protein